MFVSIVSCRFCFIFCVSFFVSDLLFFLLCSVVFAPPIIFFLLTAFLHLSFTSFVLSFIIRLCSLFPVVYLLVFPSCNDVSFFLNNMFVCACFVFAILLLFRSLSTKYLVSFVSFSFCFQHFQKQIPFSPDIWSHFWYSLLTRKSTCSKFHFDRRHSKTKISRFFFRLLTLFMFPLLCVYPPDVPSVHPPHCYSPFFLLPNTFFKKKNFSLPFSLPFIVVKPLCFFSVSFIISSFHLSLWNPFSCSSPFWFRLFSLFHFPILFFRKNKIFS